MKIKLILPILVLAFLFSCKSTEKKDLPQTKEEVAALLNGVWIYHEYLSYLEETKSTYEASNYEIPYLLGFSFEKDILLSDEPVYFGFVAHEGGYNDFFVWDDKLKLFRTERGEDAYNFIEEDYNIKVLSENKIEFDFGGKAENAVFRKADLTEFANELLFTGVYKDEEGNEVEFKTDGTTNFEGFSNYSVAFDYFEMNFDMVTFSADLDAVYYHFVIKDNTIELYDVVMLDETGFEIGDFYKVLTKK